MKIIAHTLFCLVLMLAIDNGHASQLSKSVASHGETHISASEGKLEVLVKIQTHEVSIGKPSDGRTADIRSNCTYSKYPCSIVDRLSIVVNGKELLVPRSVFCDLADLDKAVLKVDRKELAITLFGGDASESYVVKIEFDEAQVNRRTLYSALSMAQPLEDSTYHSVVMGD